MDCNSSHIFDYQTLILQKKKIKHQVSQIKLIHVNFVSPNIKIMKKYLSLIAAGALIFGLTSCKKDWTCDCTFTAVDGSTQNSTTIIPKSSKKDAQTACDQLEQSLSYANGNCTLK